MSTITLAPRVAPTRRTTSPSRPRSQVRLTRRGRLVVFLLALAVAALAAVWLAAGSAATRDDAGAPQLDLVTVAPGDTLWDIASDAATRSGDDVRDMMRTIQQLNTLDGSVVYVGQELRVPTP
ncbi:LysM peptidoglycan-binding domain-containing protein [Nocardioides carbamazepini]|uniref:LysM peptidoglycan-binding domain-containing protein n=1 Tax=Nocardioides carbamazepini TaxID=2854259 RepID=UPI002149DDE7|nr:LysM peptidoglycan-binding domain-containing protein [Nocardioides carbamazepini]MCR1786468.1 LysM peptidoglycan-binding domain-containing protein [Nocardioides carbamazepini]